MAAAPGVMQMMNLEITKAVRSVNKEDVLGYVPEKMANLGVTEETITFDMFEDFLSLIKSICSSDGYDNDVGGALIQRFDPDFVFPCPAVGQNVPAQPAPFRHAGFVMTANRRSIIHMKNREYCDFIYNLMYQTSTQHWRKIMSMAYMDDLSMGDGQYAIQLIRNSFATQNSGYVRTYVVKFKSNNYDVCDAGDPQTTLMALYDLYRVITQTPDGPTYSVKWYADEVINHLKYTEYKIFITSSRDALQTSATPYAINNMVNKFWVDNHHLWEDYEVFGAKKKKKARAFSFKGAVDGSLLCTNCGEKTHHTKKCRNEGGEKEEICFETAEL